MPRTIGQQQRPVAYAAHCFTAVLVKKKTNDTYFHNHIQSASAWNHAPHVRKNASATPKQAPKNNATTKHNSFLNQSCGSRKTATLTQRKKSSSSKKQWLNNLRFRFSVAKRKILVLKTEIDNNSNTKRGQTMAAKNRWILIAAAVLIAAFAVAAFYEITQSQPNTSITQEHTLFQVSAFNKFSSGSYEGNTTYAELASRGSFGMGTLNGLDGEMIAFDGVFYQIPSDGHAKQIPSTARTPFAMVTYFKADTTLQVTDAMNYSQLSTYIDSTLPSENSIYAVKIHGTFDYAKTRSVPLQTKPYQNLTEAIKNQTVFTFNSVKATVCGYRCPSFMDGINVAGYHLHFLTDDKSAGGHMLECTARNVTVEIDQINKFEMALP